MSKTKVIILEPQHNLCMSILFTLESQFNFDVLVSESIEDCTELISTNKDAKLLISAGRVGEVSTLSVFELASEELDNAALISTDLDITQNWDKSKINISKELRKTEIAGPLKDSIEEFFEEDSEEEDVDEFTGVSIESLAFIEKLHEDVYIKLPKTGRLLKLFSKGDNVDSNDVSKYTAKSVHHLYLNRRAATWILKQLDEHIEELINSEDARIDIDSFMDNEETPNLFVQNQEYMETVHSSKEKIIGNLKKSKDLMKLLTKMKLGKGEAAFYKNRVKMVCAISCAIAKEMGWSSDTTYEKMIYVAHVHDLTLMEHPKLLKINSTPELDMQLDLGTITEEEHRIFLEHPQQCSDLISKDPRAPQDAEMIAQQHHERPDAQGFPRKLAAIRINAFSAILIISIDLATYMLTNPKWKFKDFYEKNKTKYKGGPFTKAMQALAVLAKLK